MVDGQTQDEELDPRKPEISARRYLRPMSSDELEAAWAAVHEATPDAW